MVQICSLLHTCSVRRLASFPVLSLLRNSMKCNSASKECKCQVRVSSHCCAHCLESEAVRATLGLEPNFKSPTDSLWGVEKLRGEYTSPLINYSYLHSFTEKWGRGGLVLTTGQQLWLCCLIIESSIFYLDQDSWLHLPTCLVIISIFSSVTPVIYVGGWHFSVSGLCFQPYWPLFITCSWAHLFPAVSPPWTISVSLLMELLHL